MAHNLVDLAVLLTADEFLVLVCELDLDAHVVLRFLHEWDVADDHQCSSNSIVRSIDVEVELLKADFSAGVDADIGEHSANIGGCRWSLRRVRMGNEPRSTVELAGLVMISINPSTVRATNSQAASVRAQYARHAGRQCPGQGPDCRRHRTPS